jgi:acyl-coenzyme A thioesterase PaaI-like protein
MRLQVTELRPGYVKGAVPLEGNGNHLGTLYAGAMFGLAEIIGGALAVSSFDISRYYPVVKDLHITFRRPGRTGVTTECTLPAARIEELSAEADRTGKAEFVLDVNLTDDTGEVVATSTATYQIRRHGT